MRQIVIDSDEAPSIIYGGAYFNEQGWMGMQNGVILIIDDTEQYQLTRALPSDVYGFQGIDNTLFAYGNGFIGRLDDSGTWKIFERKLYEETLDISRDNMRILDIAGNNTNNYFILADHLVMDEQGYYRSMEHVLTQIKDCSARTIDVVSDTHLDNSRAKIEWNEQKNEIVYFRYNSIVVYRLIEGAQVRKTEYEITGVTYDPKGILLLDENRVSCLGNTESHGTILFVQETDAFSVNTTEQYFDSAIQMPDHRLLLASGLK